MNPSVVRLLRISRTVTDLARAQAFYRETLGFEPVDTAETADPGWLTLFGAERIRAVRLRLGEQEVELAAFDPPGAPYPPGSTSADAWFQHCALVTDDIGAACARLEGHGAGPISHGGPQRLPAGAGGVVAYKFRDPDSHPLELIQFPAAQSAGSDHAPAPGIDHSAIGVTDPERSVAFYADLLGLALGTQHLNTGPEQDRLDGLSDVAVAVVALHPTSSRTPHVELLGYREPRERVAPARASARDVAADKLVFAVDDFAGVLGRVQQAGIVSVGASVLLADGRAGVLIEDPDGHQIVLIG